MKPFELLDVSRYRGELMGLSAMFILICHSIAYVDMPKVLFYALSFGNVGVDLFLFLSGMGLWYSLRKRNVSLKRWYFTRYKRILVPYLFIITPITFIRYEYGLLNNMDLGYIIRFISTIQFWINHNGAWFIAALIPLYLMSPAFYCLLCRYGDKAAVVMILLFYAILLVPEDLYTFFGGEIFDNVKFVLIRATCFLLGMWMGRYIEQNKRLSLWLLVTLVFVGILAVLITEHLVYCYFFFCLPLLYVMCLFIKTSLVVRKIGSFLGRISLESYLFNGSVPVFVILIFEHYHIPDYCNILAYVIAVIIGTLLSVVFNRMYRNI